MLLTFSLKELNLFWFWLRFLVGRRFLEGCQPQPLPPSKQTKIILLQPNEVFCTDIFFKQNCFCPELLGNNVPNYKGTPQIPVFGELGGNPMFPAEHVWSGMEITHVSCWTCVIWDGVRKANRKLLWWWLPGGEYCTRASPRLWQAGKTSSSSCPLLWITELTCEHCLKVQIQPWRKQLEHTTVCVFILLFSSSVYAHGLQSLLCHIPALERWI